MHNIEQRGFLSALEQCPGLKVLRERKIDSPGIRLFLCDEVGSTMDVARLLFRERINTQFESCGFAQLENIDGVFVASARQSAGRGRANHVWRSPSGSGIYCTLTIVPRCGSAFIQGLSLVVGLAIRETVATFGVNSFLKWPNDVQAVDRNGQLRKLAGILIEAQHSGSSTLLSIGVGLNVKADKEVRAVGGVSLEEISHQILSPDAILATLFSQLVRFWLHFEKVGFLAFREDWLRHSTTIGNNVRVALGEEFIQGKAIGIDDYGALEVLTASGVQIVHAGEIREDMAMKETEKEEG